MRIIFWSIVLALRLSAAGPDAAWEKLGSLERSTYTILLRDRTCESGRIRAVEQNKLFFESGNDVTRAEILFVGEELSAHDVLYSGRSSWRDVIDLNPYPLESLEVRLKSGKSTRGSFITGSDWSITVKRFGRSVKISRDQVTEVEYVRFKPVSEAHQYFAQEVPELKLLDPKPCNTS